MHRSVLCRSRRDVSNEYLVAKIGLDPAENEPCKVCPLSVYRLILLLQIPQVWGNESSELVPSYREAPMPSQAAMQPCRSAAMSATDLRDGEAVKGPFSAVSFFSPD